MKSIIVFGVSWGKSSWCGSFLEVLKKSLTFSRREVWSTLTIADPVRDRSQVCDAQRWQHIPPREPLCSIANIVCQPNLQATTTANTKAAAANKFACQLRHGNHTVDRLPNDLLRKKGYEYTSMWFASTVFGYNLAGTQKYFVIFMLYRFHFLAD